MDLNGVVILFNQICRMADEELNYCIICLQLVSKSKFFKKRISVFYIEYIIIV